MSGCMGREITTEVVGHLGVREELADILEHAICIPCMMPFMTSQFLPQEQGDRPAWIPKETRNLAFMGQFCEQPNDVVFTVEFSIRSAETAVCRLLALIESRRQSIAASSIPACCVEAFARCTTRCSELHDPEGFP